MQISTSHSCRLLKLNYQANMSSNSAAEMYHILVAHVLNDSIDVSSLTEHHVVELELGQFLDKINHLAREYRKTFQYPNDNADVDSDFVKKLVQFSEFSRFVSFDDEKLKVELTPLKFQALLTGILVDSSIRYSKMLAREVNDLTEKYHELKPPVLAIDVSPVGTASISNEKPLRKEIESSAKVSLDSAEIMDIIHEPIAKNEEEEQKKLGATQEAENTGLSEKDDEHQNEEVDSEEAQEAATTEAQDDAKDEVTGNYLESDGKKNAVEVIDKEVLKEERGEDEEQDEEDEKGLGDEKSVQDEKNVQDVEMEDAEELEAESNKTRMSVSEEASPAIEDVQLDVKKDDAEAAESVNIREKETTVLEGEQGSEVEDETNEDVEPHENELPEVEQRPNEVTPAKEDNETKVDKTKANTAKADSMKLEDSTKSAPSEFLNDRPSKRSLSPLVTSQKHKRFQNIAINLVKTIEEHRFLSPFLLPVVADQYEEVVYDPKDLKSILKAIKQKDEPAAYETVKELERDIMLMFANCVMYNKSNAHLVDMAKQMRDDVRNTFKMFEDAESEIA